MDYFKTNKVNNNKIYINQDDENYTELNDEKENFYFLKPKEFIKDRDKILKEFIKKKNDHIIKNNIVKTNISHAYFQAIPNIVIFTSYVPFKKYECLVNLKNIDVNARNLKIEIEENQIFKINYTSDIKKKVAPGMIFSFKIEFYPKSCVNYEYDLEIYSDNKSFILPIRCINNEIVLDVQDEIIIDETPIYLKNEKSITIKNIGKYENKFNIILNPPFYINSCIYTLEAGEIIELKVIFLPLEDKIYEDYMIINYENGIRTYTKIRSKGIIANVLIKDKEIFVDDVYINKSKEISIFIKNLSFFLLTYNIIKYEVFEYKYDNCSTNIKDANFRDEDKIIEKTFITDNELSDQNIIENLLYKNEEPEYSNGDKIYSEENAEYELTNNEIIPNELNEEYKDNKKGYNYEDNEIYNHKNFTRNYESSNDSFNSFCCEKKKNKIINIYPKTQKLYNDTETIITVIVNPHFASFLKIVLFLFIKGYKKKEKIVIYLKSITPEIIISNNLKKIDSILINTCKTLSFELINNSQIDAHIKIKKTEDENNEFQIVHNKIIIPEKSQKTLKIIYIPKISGLFEKTFIIHQKYTNVKKELKIISNCIFPEILFDKDHINFNNVSHSFKYEQTFYITNNSDLTLNYTFKICDELKEEIKILKQHGELCKYEKEKIQFIFFPKKIKKYFYDIEFLLDEIKTYKKIIPFYAICSRPDVEVQPNFLNLEQIIIDKEYRKQIKLINKSENIDIKYELILDKQINDVCYLEVSESEGIISRNDFKHIDICIKSKIVGYLLIVIKIKISGYEDLLFLNIKAYSACPTIKIIPSIIDFEKCNCLEIKEKIIEIKNESPIKTFIKLSNELSIFTYSENNFYIPPSQSIFIKMYAKCIETIIYHDTLRINVHHMNDVIIPIKAQGIGCPILINDCSINFEVIYTNKKYFHELIIFNKGINERNIHFLFESEKKRKNKNDYVEIFNVTPKSLSIKGGSETVCVLSAFNSKEEKCEDVLYVFEDLMNTKKLSKNFKKIKILSSFIHPEIEICDISRFVYNFYEVNMKKEDKEEKEENEENEIVERIKYIKNLNKLMQEIEVKNLKNANIKFTLSTKSPFFVEPQVIELKSKEKKKIPIYFDIDFMNNKISKIYEENLLVNFFENSKRQKYELVGETIYPNIVMNKNVIDFQYILKNLYAQETLEIKNVCNFKVYFKWYFEENNINKNFNEVFNINPSKGYLLPSEKKLITVTYNSINENYYNINSLCEIKNGPVYPLKLIAGYSEIKYSINKKELNYYVHYKSIGEDFLTIQNTGKIKLFVEIIYTIKFPSILYTNINNFFIEPYNSKDIIFYFIPGLPLKISENILIKICNFEEIKVKLNSNNFCNILHLNVDNINNNEVYNISNSSQDEIRSETSQQIIEKEETKNEDLKNLDDLINNTFLFVDEDSIYENQRKTLTKKLKKVYLSIFLSLKKSIEEILDIYYLNENNKKNFEKDESDNIYKTNVKTDETSTCYNTSYSETNASIKIKYRYEIINILKMYCSKNNKCIFFVDLLKSLILNQKDDNYILNIFSKLKKLVNFENISCHNYINNEYILKYLKRVILESNIELKTIRLNIGNLIINERKESTINIKNVSNDKIILNFNMKESESKDIMLVYDNNEINKNNSINLKIVIQKSCTEEKIFLEKIFLYLNDNNYYIINVKFNYIIPDILLYYKQINFEKVEIKTCLCKVNRLINTKKVNIKFKVKKIIFYNKKLEYYHLKRKTQIFIAPTKGIIKNNSYLDIKIFFEPSNIYRNAKIRIEIFIYHSNIIKTIDVYLNSTKDNVYVDKSDIIIKPLLLNSGEKYETVKIYNINNYSKYLYIYKLDNYYNFYESFIYDLLIIHKHIYIKKNDEKDLFYGNLIHYLIDIYKKKMKEIKNNYKKSKYLNSDNKNLQIENKQDDERELQIENTMKNDEKYNKNSFDKVSNVLANEEKNNRCNKIDKEKKEEKKKTEKYINPLSCSIFSEEYNSNELIIDIEYTQENVKVLENKIKILEELNIKNEVKYNYFEEYLKITKIKKKIKENYVIICPKYTDHKKIGSYLLKNNIINFSKKKKKENKNCEYDNFLTINKIIHWCNELNDKDSYPCIVKKNFIHYLIYERSINNNNGSTKQILNFTKSINENIKGGELVKNFEFENEISSNYYVSEQLNGNEKKKESLLYFCEDNDKSHMEIKKDIYEVNKTENIDENVKKGNKNKNFKKENTIGYEENKKFINIYKNKFKKKLTKNHIKSKIDNKHITYINKKKGNNINSSNKYHEVSCTYDEKTFFNKYNLKYKFEYINHFFNFSILNDELFMNEVRLFLKLIMSEKKKGKSENSIKKKNNFLNLFENILKKILVSPFYINGVVFFFKKNNYINPDNFLNIFLKINTDENVLIIYLNPIEKYEEFLNLKNNIEGKTENLDLRSNTENMIVYGKSDKKSKETNDKKQYETNDKKKNETNDKKRNETNDKKQNETNDKKQNETNDKKQNETNDKKQIELIGIQRIKCFYENLTKTYQRKIEKKLDEKKKIEKIIELLNINYDENTPCTIDENKDKKNIDIKKKKTILKRLTKEIEYKDNEALVNESCSDILDNNELGNYLKKNEKLEDNENNKIHEKNISVIEYFEDNGPNPTHNLYEKMKIYKEKYTLNKQIINELSMKCSKRKENVDYKIIKYNKKVNKINNYMKNSNYMDYAPFYKELKTILRNILKEYLKKNMNFSNTDNFHESEDIITLKNDEEIENKKLEYEKKKSFIKKVNLELSDNFIEKIYEEIDINILDVNVKDKEYIKNKDTNNFNERECNIKIEFDKLNNKHNIPEIKKKIEKITNENALCDKDNSSRNYNVTGGITRTDANNKDENIKTIIDKNEELIKYLKQTFVHITFIFFFVNDEIYFKKKKIMNEISKNLYQNYSDVKTSAYFFDIPYPKIYDSFNLKNFIQRKKNLEKCESIIHVDNNRGTKEKEEKETKVVEKKELHTVYKEFKEKKKKKKEKKKDTKTKIEKEEKEKEKDKEREREREGEKEKGEKGNIESEKEKEKEKEKNRNKEKANEKDEENEIEDKEKKKKKKKKENNEDDKKKKEKGKENEKNTNKEKTKEKDKGKEIEDKEKKKDNNENDKKMKENGKENEKNMNIEKKKENNEDDKKKKKEKGKENEKNRNKEKVKEKDEGKEIEDKEKKKENNENEKKKKKGKEERKKRERKRERGREGEEEEKEKEKEKEKNIIDEARDSENIRNDDIYQIKEHTNKHEKLKKENIEEIHSERTKSVKINMNEKKIKDVYYEELEKKKYEIKDEYDYMFYKCYNSYNKNKLIGNINIEDGDQKLIEFLQMDTHDDKKDMIQYKNITHFMLEKNNNTEIYIKINTCKITNMKKTICLIDILGNYIFLNIHIIIDKPKIYSNPYFIFNNNVSLFDKSNCFILSKKIYNFDKVLIGKNLSTFKDLIESELKEEGEEYVEFLKKFEGIHLPKFKINKYKIKNISTLEYSVKEKMISNNIDMIRNKDILKHLYKHVQILNLFNPSYFDCFVELSFDDKLHNYNENKSPKRKSVDNFLIYNDFYIYPDKFFILSKKFQKIIILFLPKNPSVFFENLLLSIYAVKEKISDKNDKLSLNNEKNMIEANKEINKSDKIFQSENLSINNIDILNKEIDNSTFDIFTLSLKGEGIRCSLKIDQNYLNFHKILLNSTYKKTIEIKNNSYCEILWYIDSNDLKDNYLKINPVKGNLLKNEKKIITICINANKVDIIKKKIKINYLEKNLTKKDKEKNNLYFTLFDIEAEICKSFVQINFEILDENKNDKNNQLIDNSVGDTNNILKNNNLKNNTPLDILKGKTKEKLTQSNKLYEVIEKEINFMHVQVNEVKFCLFKIKNTGKIKISFFLELNDDYFLNFITIDKISDSINSNEIKLVKLKLKSNKKIKFQNIPLFIHIYDIDNNYIQSYKYLCSVFFDYNYLKIIPPILNFDSIEIKKEETKFFKIINNGYFDFKYEIKLIKNKIKNRDDKLLENNNTGNYENNKIHEIDPFTIFPTIGLIKSKEEQTISVLFNSSEEKYYKYIYIVDVDNLMPDVNVNNKYKKIKGKKEKEKHGELIKIFASSVTPRISCNIQNIFEEVFVLKKMDVYRDFLDFFLSKNSYYNVDDNTLYYKYSYVNEFISERIKITNISDINVNVKIEVKEIDFLDYKYKKGKEKEKEKEKEQEITKEKEMEKRKIENLIQTKSSIKFHMRVQNYNEVKKKWILSEDDNNDNNTFVITRYQNKYIDLCFYSSQIVSKKFLVNVYIEKSQNFCLCFSFYISVEFFLPSINFIMLPNLLKLNNENKVFDLGDIHLNSVISIKVKLKNFFKYPVFIKIFFEKINTLFENMNDGQVKKQINNKKELKNQLNVNENIEQIKDDDKLNNQIKENEKLKNHQNDEKKKCSILKNKKIANKNIKTESIIDKNNIEKPLDKYDVIHNNEVFSNNPYVEEKKDVFEILNNNNFFNNIRDNILLKRKNNIIYFDHKNIKDIIYDEKIRKKKIEFGYFQFIGHDSYILRENDMVYFDIKINKKKIQEEINRRQIKDQLNKKDIEEDISKNSIGEDSNKKTNEDYLQETNAEEEMYKKNNEDELSKTNDENELYKKKKKKKKKLNKKKNDKNVCETTGKNIIENVKSKKEVLGSINIEVLNNIYEFYNLKFLGNIKECKNYWNLQILKRQIKYFYKNNFFIFKNHINLDILPINYNNIFKLYYTNENSYDLYFNIEMDKKIKNFIDINPSVGHVPSNSTTLFSLKIEIKESINLTKKKIPCRFSMHPFNKKNVKISDSLVYDDDLYISLESTEIKVSYNKKKISFKNIPFFNYSKNKLLLENLSNVKLYGELNIIPVNDLDDITSVYSFVPFKEQNIISLLEKNNTNLLFKEKIEDKKYFNCLSSEKIEMKNIKNDLQISNKIEKKKKNENDDLLKSSNIENKMEKGNEDNPIDEFYLTKYDLNISDFDNNNHNNNFEINFNETNKIIDKNKIIKKCFTINGKSNKYINIYCFHHIYKKTFDAMLHIKIKLYDEIKIPIEMVFENDEKEDIFLLTNFKHKEIVDKKEIKKIEKKNEILIISRGILNKINHKIYMLNISNRIFEYLFEKSNEICETEGASLLTAYSKNGNSNNNNVIDCVNYKGSIKENNFSIIKFLFNSFNSLSYKGNYNFYINNKKQENIEFQLKVIEPLVFFNTSFIHINNLILEKSYCFVFYLINFDLIDINFEFDNNSYSSFNSKREVIKIIPSKGTIKSCYKKNKYFYKNLHKSMYDNNEKNNINKNKLNTLRSASSSFIEENSMNYYSSECKFSNRILYDNFQNTLIRKKKKKKSKVNYSDGLNTKNSSSDGSINSSQKTSSLLSSQSNFNSYKNKIKLKNNNHIYNGNKGSRDRISEKYDLDTSCSSDSESSTNTLKEHEKLNNKKNNKFFLINYYLKNIWNVNNGKFKKEIKHIIGKGRSQKIKLYFKPYLEQFYNFSILCKIETKEEPLKINFKMQASRININCYIENFDKEKIRLNLQNSLLRKKNKNNNDLINIYETIDFKETLIGKKKVSNFIIENLCSYDLFYKYYLQKNDDEISIQCSNSYISSSSILIITVEYKPLINQIYENYLILNIADFYIINLKITAISTNFLINFSFHNYDFGNIILFPILDKYINIKKMNLNQYYENSFSSTNSSLSSLMSTYKMKEREKKKKKEMDEKEKNINIFQKDKIQDTENDMKKEKKKKEKYKDEETDKVSHKNKKEKSKKLKKGDKIKNKMKEELKEEDKEEIYKSEINKIEVNKNENTVNELNSLDMKKNNNIEKENDNIDMMNEEENINTAKTKLFIYNNNDEDCYIEYELNECSLKIINSDKKIYLKKRSKTCLIILFKPNEEKNYNYKIPFIINNDLNKIVYIYFTGSANYFKLPFTCNNSNEINFKDVHVGKESINKFTLHNKNSKDISFNIFNYKDIEKYFLSFVKFDNGNLHILKKKEKKTFEIKFLPEKYIQLEIPLYLNINLDEKFIVFYLTNIKVNSVCYKVVLKEKMLTFNKMDTKEDDISKIQENLNDINEIKKKLFKGSNNNKDSINCKKIQLHNTGDMNAQFQIFYPQKYEKFLFLYPKKGIIFSLNIIDIYVFIDTDFISKDLFINDIVVELFPKFNKINNKVFFNIFINSSSNMIKYKSTGMNNLKTIINENNTEELKKELEEEKNISKKNHNVDCMEKKINIFPLKNETIITFLTDIRKEIRKKIEIFNDSQSNFKLKYKFLSNEQNFFSIVKNEDVIKANDSGSFDIVYNPLFVLKKKNNNNYRNNLCEKYQKYCSKIHHLSKLVIYYPNDVIKNYTLLGYSDNNSYEKKICFNLNSKSLNNASVRIKNWINENQTLIVSYYCCDKDLKVLNNNLLFFYIQNKFDLTIREEKHLFFKVTSLKEGIFYVLLILSNEKYEDKYKILLQFEMFKSDFLCVKNINGNKKEILKENVFIYNPLDENILMDTIFDYTYVFFDNSIVLEKKKNNKINVYFCIVKNEKDKNVIISFSNRTLGNYNFKFVLNINMNEFEENFYFNTDLGSLQINEISFTNVCNQKINYDVVIEDFDENNENSKQIFQCEDKITVKPIDTSFFLKNDTLNNLSDKICLTIKYNPPDIRINKAILKLVSKEGIIYKGLLIGKSVSPKPRGPIFCSSQKTTLIDFTNPFFQMKQFFLKADENFIIPFENVKIEARQTIQIPIKCKTRNATSGKLILKSENDNIWMYYLTGQ
ncbi:conserved Plasmodium protein, unknown function [Plasmodium gallinaceum]|uniref:MSP domain-containing protein n=1 Tax=Plasmodium gallinaceum TaxID=5849 RepID=A0A1J1GQU5_PLAGA|nr:conserved Plasmodium protein, unknown function [Plasmodium gallinaceum]CRG94636.1 conserved Plasmodium protein, unknown function [Plasmodium gallinaceum]